MRAPPSLSVCAAVLGLGALVSAQAATARAHTLLQHELSDGRRTNSSTYVLDSAVGVGATARRATSRSYVLQGGFSSTLDVPGTGKPWLTAVQPRFITLLGKPTVRLKGTELHLGSSPTVRVGGIVTAVVTRTPHELTTTLPVLRQPGWLPVEVQNSLGNTVLPRGIGVLPLLDVDPAPTSGKDFDLVFRGAKGDIVIWAMGIGQNTPVVLPGAHFGFALKPTLFFVYPGFAITGNDGVLRIPSQAAPYPVGMIYVQALFVSTHPGYAPGSFSNVIIL